MSEAKEAERKRDIWLERGITLVSGAIVLAALGGLLYLDPPTGPAVLEVAAGIEQTYREGPRLVVPFEVANHGSEPVEEVKVEVTILGSDQKFETTIGHLGRGMTARGMAYFDDVPPDAKASARIVGFLFP